MRSALIPLWALLTLWSCPTTMAGQWAGVPKAALPEVPYWWPVVTDQSLGVVPLAWTNDVDAVDGGCCVVGAAARYERNSTMLWFGIGFGTDPEGGAPAALEAGAEIEGGTVAYRQLHGRGAFSGFYPVHLRSGGGRVEQDRVGVGLSAVWLDDPRYLEPFVFFDCPEAAPSVACSPVQTSYPWSDGRDHALAVEAELGTRNWGLPRLEGNLVVGLKALGSTWDYVRLEAAAAVVDSVVGARLEGRLSAGWSSTEAPLQRRFLLDGADPITRWLNPYIEAAGALLSDVPYFTPGGPHLRAYGATRPLTKRYIGAAAELSEEEHTREGLWGRASIFLEAAWTPGLPDRFGPEQINAESTLLFDWRELPDGEDQAQGRFRARALKVAEIWADAGISFAGGYDKLAVAVAFPLWASAPAFADEPITGEKKAFALRWTLTLTFYPTGRPAQ
ncbi:MAG: hypothetical protein JSU87_16670 [Gemmatimonadota bacterium]|nr:MAG: hypothetical protein JSU87_16670 [Gemmatimonadota bacterium]